MDVEHLHEVAGDLDVLKPEYVASQLHKAAEELRRLQAENERLEDANAALVEALESAAACLRHRISIETGSHVHDLISAALAKAQETAGTPGE